MSLYFHYRGIKYRENQSTATVEALMEGMNSSEGQKLGSALLEDEKNFIDHSKSSAFIVNEHEF